VAIRARKKVNRTESYHGRGGFPGQATPKSLGGAARDAGRENANGKRSEGKEIFSSPGACRNVPKRNGKTPLSTHHEVGEILKKSENTHYGVSSNLPAGIYCGRRRLAGAAGKDPKMQRKSLRLSAPSAARYTSEKGGKRRDENLRKTRERVSTGGKGSHRAGFILTLSIGGSRRERAGKASEKITVVLPTLSQHTRCGSYFWVGGRWGVHEPKGEGAVKNF